MTPARGPGRRALLEAAAARLREAGSDDPRADAEQLLCAALGLRRVELWRAPEEVPEPAARARLEAWLERHAAGEPLAYLEGRCAFHGLELRVDPRVLVPRPDSETLVDLAVELLGARPPRLVVDVGTGSGCLLLALLRAFPRARGLGVDLSAGALQVARDNAARLGLATRARFLRGRWLAALGGGGAGLVVSNPPYVVPGEELGAGIAEHEPREALFTPPGDPLWAYRALCAQAHAVLAPGGLLVVEAGAGRAAAVARLAADAGWRTERVARDLGGHERALALAPAS